jgi:hypothetical protein
MAKTVIKRKTQSKSIRKKRTKQKETPLEEVESSMEGIALTDFAETTKEQLKKLGDIVHEATDKGVHVVKDIAEEVQRFARDKTELTKIKIKLHHLKAEREKLFTLMGEQLRNLYKSKKLTDIKKRFKADFEKLEELEKTIDEHEKQAGELS